MGYCKLAYFISFQPIYGRPGKSASGLFLGPLFRKVLLEVTWAGKINSFDVIF